MQTLPVLEQETDAQASHALLFSLAKGHSSQEDTLGIQTAGESPGGGGGEQGTDCSGSLLGLHLAIPSVS
jgi:hypothetical protein